MQRVLVRQVLSKPRPAHVVDRVVVVRVVAHVHLGRHDELCAVEPQPRRDAPDAGVARLRVDDVDVLVLEPLQHAAQVVACALADVAHVAQVLDEVGPDDVAREAAALGVRVEVLGEGRHVVEALGGDLVRERRARLDMARRERLVAVLLAPAARGVVVRVADAGGSVVRGDESVDGVAQRDEHAVHRVGHLAPHRVHVHRVEGLVPRRQPLHGHLVLRVAQRLHHRGAARLANVHEEEHGLGRLEALVAPVDVTRVLRLLLHLLHRVLPPPLADLEPRLVKLLELLARLAAELRDLRHGELVLLPAEDARVTQRPVGDRLAVGDVDALGPVGGEAA